jgi:hypothetical protein
MYHNCTMYWIDKFYWFFHVSQRCQLLNQYIFLLRSMGRLLMSPMKVGLKSMNWYKSTICVGAWVYVSWASLECTISSFGISRIEHHEVHKRTWS